MGTAISSVSIIKVDLAVPVAFIYLPSNFLGIPELTAVGKARAAISESIKYFNFYC